MLDLENCMSAEEIYEALTKCSDATMKELNSAGLRDGLTQTELIQLFDFCSDNTIRELADMGVFGPIMTFDLLAQLCSGTEEGGLPNSFGVLQIDTVTEEMETVPYASVAFGNPAINIYAAGGCVVITADFERHNMFEYRRARDILGEWTENQGSPEFNNKLLSLVVSPVLLNGEIMIIFHELVFAQGVAIEDGVCRLIMAFDGNQTQNIMSTNIKLDELKTTVEAEIARREAEARAAMEAAQQEAEDEDKVANPYEQAIEETYKKSWLSDDMGEEPGDDEFEDIPEDDSGSVDKPDDWMRITKD